MELHKLYRAILASMNVVADPSGLLSLEYDGESHPIQVDNKRLVLPTPEVLRNGLGDSLVAFHPLSENILRGESPVLRKMKLFVTTKLTQVFSQLMEKFVSIAADHKSHVKLSPDQKELPMVIPEADEKTYQTLQMVFKAMRDDARRKLISVYLKRGGRLRTEKYSRTAIVSFPILGEFENEEYVIYGVKCRKKDYIGLQKLIDYILPGADTNSYSYGSNDQDVPYFDALIHAFINVATQLNSRVSMFAKHLPNAHELLIDLSWNTVDNTHWSKYRDLIPVLNGNDGVVTTEEAEETATISQRRPGLAFDPAKAAASAAAPVYGDTPQIQPQQPGAQNHHHGHHKAEEIRTTSNGLNWQDVLNSQQRRSLHPSVAYPALPPGVQVNAGYAYAPQVMPGQPQPQMMMAPQGYPPQGYPQPMPMIDPAAYGLPPGFGPATPPPPTHDAYGRPMAAPMMAMPMMHPNGAHFMPQPGFGQPPPGYPPGYGMPPGYPQQPYYQPNGVPPGNPGRVPSFGMMVPQQGYAPMGAAPPQHPGMNYYATGAAGVPVHYAR